MQAGGLCIAAMSMTARFSLIKARLTRMYLERHLSRHRVVQEFATQDVSREFVLSGVSDLAQDHLAQLREDANLLTNALQQARQLGQAAAESAAAAAAATQARSAAHKVQPH